MYDLATKFLEHYGTKGMRWGVRKERKAIEKNFASITADVQGRQAVRRMGLSLDEFKYSQLSNKDVVVGKDSVIKRTTRNPDGDKLQENSFVSTNEADAARYRAILPASNRDGFVSKSYDQHYETTFKATQDLMSPSERTRVDGYITLMGKKDIRLTTGEVVDGREYVKRQGLGDTINHMTNRQVALTYYGQLVSTQGIQNEPLNTAYFREMKQRGYNAIVDDNDRGILSARPLLVLDAQRNLQRTGVRPLTNEEIHTAQAMLKLPDR